MSVYRRGKSWCARVQDGRKQVWLGTFQTRTEAKEAEAAALAERDKTPERPPSVVYFIQDGDDGPIKIGTSQVERLPERLRALQVGNPRELFIRATTPGNWMQENKTQWRFADARIRGEWFAATPELLEHIASLNVAEEAEAA